MEKATGCEDFLGRHRPSRRTYRAHSRSEGLVNNLNRSRVTKGSWLGVTLIWRDTEMPTCIGKNSCIAPHISRRMISRELGRTNLLAVSHTKLAAPTFHIRIFKWSAQLEFLLTVCEPLLITLCGQRPSHAHYTLRTGLS